MAEAAIGRGGQSLFVAEGGRDTHGDHKVGHRYREGGLLLFVAEGGRDTHGDHKVSSRYRKGGVCYYTLFKFARSAEKCLIMLSREARGNFDFALARSAEKLLISVTICGRGWAGHPRGPQGQPPL